jgi:hypothetical protein
MTIYHFRINCGENHLIRLGNAASLERFDPQHRKEKKNSNSESLKSLNTSVFSLKEHFIGTKQATKVSKVVTMWFPFSFRPWDRKNF